MSLSIFFPDFSIASSIVVTSPLATTTFTTGRANTITWIASNVTASVTISLVLQGQVTSYQVIASNIANTGSYSWIASVLIPAGNYFVLVSTTGVTPPVYGAGPALGAFKLVAGGLSRVWSDYMTHS